MLHKIDLFYADSNYFIVLRKKNEPVQLIYSCLLYFCTGNKKRNLYNIFPTFPFSDIDIIRMWNKYKEKNEIKILVIWI